MAKLPILFVSLGLILAAHSSEARPPAKRSSRATLAQHGKTWLGVKLARLTKLDRRQRKVPRYGGVLVLGVIPKSPAHRAGLEAGDVLMRLDNRYVYNPDAVIRKVQLKRAGQLLKVDIIRNGQWMMARVSLQSRPLRGRLAALTKPRTAARTPGLARRSARPAARPERRASGSVATAEQRIRALERQVRALRAVSRHLRGFCKRLVRPRKSP